MVERAVKKVVPLRERMESGFHTGQLNEDFVDDIASLIEKAKDIDAEDEDAPAAEDG